MIFLQGILAVAVLGVSLLLFAMVRQIGVISQRIPKRSDSTKVIPLAVGTSVPVSEFETFDRRNRVGLSDGEKGTLVVFAVT